MEKADLPPAVTPHTLRHTCATLLYKDAGASPLEISRHLGHRSVTVTMNTYIHLFEGGLEDVMARLDEHHRTAAQMRPSDGPTVVDFPG